MGIKKKKKVEQLESLRKDIPIPSKIRSEINTHRKEIENILNGTDERLLVIIGPCSAWPSEAVREYASRLAVLAATVETQVKVVMRVYTQKPRTTKGWAGAIVQPDPFSAPDTEKGAVQVRKLMLKVAEMGLPIADELLFTHKCQLIGDLVSWVAIGARSTEDQEHRAFASALKTPVGMKNGTSGSIEIGVNSVVSAQSEHTYYSHGYQYETDGNPLAHLVLRGGASGPNYQEKRIAEALALMEKYDILNPAIIIDASHDNAEKKGTKDYSRQVNVVQNVLRQRKRHPEITRIVKGFIIESFIKEGSQNLDSCTAETVDKEGLSITDPCIGWEDTEKLIMQLAGKI